MFSTGFDILTTNTSPLDPVLSTATTPGWTSPGPVDEWGCSEIPRDLKPRSQRLNGNDSRLISGGKKS